MHIHACLRSYTLDEGYHGIFAHIWAYFSRFRDIQDPCITGPNSINQHLLLKSRSSIKSLSKSIWKNFSFLFQKQTFNIFLIRITIKIFHNNNKNNNMPPSQRATHVTHVSTKSTQTHHPPHQRNTRQRSTHFSTSITPPTPTMLTRFLRMHATHATHASTPTTQARYPLCPCQHEQHAISQTGLKVSSAKRLSFLTF